jgi:hypothetical protein
VSGALGLAFANAISLAVPELDTGRGLEGSFEHYVASHDVTLAGTAEFRETATGDYTGWRGGVGIEARMYRHHMRGWFLGSGVYLATDFTHDHPDNRWLDPTLEVGVTVRGGYRWVPWKQLAITPSAGLGAHRDFDLSGRLPTWTRGGFAVGLDVGWLF